MLGTKVKQQVRDEVETNLQEMLFARFSPAVEFVLLPLCTRAAPPRWRLCAITALYIVLALVFVHACCLCCLPGQCRLGQGHTSFVGGLATSNFSSSGSDSLRSSGVALSVMDYQSANFGDGDQGGISAHKAWFFLPMGTIALAYNISGVAGECHKYRQSVACTVLKIGDAFVTAPAAEIVTTLEQSLLANPGGNMGGGSTVCVGAGAGAPTVVPPGNSTVPAGHWVHHDGKVYTPIETPEPEGGTTTVAEVPATWKLETGVRSGSWMTINGGLDNTTDGEVISLPVFLLEATHGPTPTGVSFAYAVLPGIGAASAAGTAVSTFEASTKVVSNNAEAQAVLVTSTTGEDMLMIAAWPAAGTTIVDSGKGLKVTLSAPTKGGLITVEMAASGAIFSAADPTNNSEGRTLTFTIDKPLEDLVATTGVRASQTSPVTCKKAAEAGSTTVTIALPSGSAAGSTVSGRC